MYEIDEQSLANWKLSFAKGGVAYETDEEYYEAIHNLVGFIDMLIEINRSQMNLGELKDSKGEMYVYTTDGDRVIL